MLNLCVKKFSLCTWQTLLLVQTVIVLSDQSCDRENVEHKSQKIIAIFIFCKGSSDTKNFEPENDNEGEDSGAMPASFPSSSDIIPPSLQLNDLLNHLLSLSSQIKCHQEAEEHKERHPW